MLLFEEIPVENRLYAEALPAHDLENIGRAIADDLIPHDVVEENLLLFDEETEMFLFEIAWAFAADENFEARLAVIMNDNILEMLRLVTV